jgi:PhnB protein
VYPTAADAQRIFDTSTDGDQVITPLLTFRAEAFGVATDRFGTPWMVNRMAPS